MGNACKTSKYGNGEIAPDDHNDEGGAPKHTGASMHALVVCVNYQKDPGYELTATDDGDNILQLLDVCGCTDVVKLYNDQCTIAAVEKAIADVASRCRRDDYFIFYYSGHGGQVPDEDGDEEDGMDSTLCLVGADGVAFPKGRKFPSMTDDDFAATVQNALPAGVNLIVLADCCHSGTITDFDKPEWGKTRGCTFSGCLDEQESEDTGAGGIFTHALLLAISNFTISRNDDYSCAQLYNAMTHQNEKNFKGEQVICVSCTNACDSPADLAWPLIPLKPYASPATKKSLRRLAMQSSTHLTMKR